MPRSLFLSWLTEVYSVLPLITFYSPDVYRILQSVTFCSPAFIIFYLLQLFRLFGFALFLTFILQITAF